jgi:ketosteroid isomerase-like protein
MLALRVGTRELQESRSKALIQKKAISMKFTGIYRVAVLVAVSLLASVVISRVAKSAKATDGPTTESVMAAEEDLARAMRENNADGIARWLSDDWAVISGKGGVGEGKTIFPDGIRQGYLTRKTFEISEPRVRVYGNVAFVTTKLNTSGMFGGKPFDVVERQTDIWVWKDGGWKCVLTHETLEK